MSDKPEPITVRYRVLADPARGLAADNIVYVELTAAYRNQAAPLAFIGTPTAIEDARFVLEGAPTYWGRSFHVDDWALPEELRAAMASERVSVHGAAVLVSGGELFERPERPPAPYVPDPDDLVHAAGTFILRIDSPPYSDGVSGGGVRSTLGGYAHVLRVWAKTASLDELVALVTASRSEWDARDVRDAFETLLALGDEPMEDLEQFKLRARARNETTK